MDFPSRTAASIRIINSLHPLLMAGIDVTLYTASMSAKSVAEGMEFYGLTPTNHLRVKPVLDFTAGDAELQRCLVHALDCVPSANRHVVITRGESGLEVMRHLRAIPKQTNLRLIFEAHRLCYLHARENGKSKSETATTWELERDAVQYADGLICVTPDVLKVFTEQFQPTAASLILPNGAVLPPTIPSLSTRDIEILYVGKLHTRKGVYDLVQAMAFMPGRHVTIVGGRDDAQVELLRREAHRQGVIDRLTLTGFVPPHQVYALLARAKVGVCPLPAGISVIADRFTCPIKIMEMMAWGTPIVATEMAPVRALLEHGKTALLVTPNDPKALAGAIEELLLNPHLAQRLAIEARFRAEHQSWQERANDLLKFMESI